MSLQNCLAIFDQKQGQVDDYMIQKLQEEQQRLDEAILNKQPRY